MQTLAEIYQRYIAPEGGHGDKGTAHTYIPVYEKILEPYRENGSILEIGIHSGLSLKMWREYFNNGMVAGADIVINQPVIELLNNENYKIFHCDATKAEFLTQLNGLTFDVIIDDGSHDFQDQLDSFNLLKNSVNKNGVYIIEDIQLDYHKKSILETLHDNIIFVDNRPINPIGASDDVLIIFNL